MPGDPWTRDEVETIAQEYFKVLRAELTGRPISKADAKRRAQASLSTPRSEHTIDDRFRRISEELWKRDLPYVQGWRPSEMSGQRANTANMGAVIWSAIEHQAATFRPPDPEPVVELAADGPASPTGQGFLSDAERRLAIEDYAQSMVMAHFARRGWNVEDTHLHAPYDAVARKGTEVQYLEAKGTMSDGATVLVTSGEVDWARSHVDQCVMGIVSGIKFSASGDIDPASGTLRLLDWNPDSGLLVPTQFAWAPAP